MLLFNTGTASLHTSAVGPEAFISIHVLTANRAVHTAEEQAVDFGHVLGSDHVRVDLDDLLVAVHLGVEAVDAARLLHTLELVAARRPLEHVVHAGLVHRARVDGLHSGVDVNQRDAAIFTPASQDHVCSVHVYEFDFLDHSFVRLDFTHPVQCIHILQIDATLFIGACQQRVAKIHFQNR